MQIPQKILQSAISTKRWHCVHSRSINLLSDRWTNEKIGFLSAHQTECHLSSRVSRWGNLTQNLNHQNISQSWTHAASLHMLTRWLPHKKVIFETVGLQHDFRPVSCDGWWHKDKGLFSMCLRGSCSCMLWLQFLLTHIQDDISPNSTKMPYDINNLRLSPRCWSSVSRLYTSYSSYPGCETLASMTQQHQRIKQGG